MSSQQPAKPPRRLWRWCKRLLIPGVALLVVLVAFHRPILLALIQWAGPKGAAMQNLPLEWQVRGSLWKDFEISELKTGGGEAHWLPRATIGRLGIAYDSEALVHSRFERALNSVALHETDIELDPRKLPKSSHAPAYKAAPPSDKPPPLPWPEVIDLTDINAAVTLADGNRIVVRGFSLRIGAGMPGILECQEFRMEPDGLTLGPLSARVAWEPRKITITNLSLPQNLELETLAADLTDWDRGRVLARIAARLGSAKFTADADVSGLFKAPMHLKAAVKARDVRATELRTVGLPRSVEFEKGDVDLLIEGDPLAPRTLSMDASLSVASLRTSGAAIDQMDGSLALHDGHAEVKSLKIARAGNTIEAGANADLPADLKEWQKTKWTAHAKAALPDAGSFLDNPPPLKGRISLDAKAEGAGATPTSVSGALSGDALAFQEYRLPKLRTTFGIDGKQARLEIPSLELGAGNTVSLSAALDMNDAMPVDAKWSVRVADAAALFATTGLKPPPEPVKGAVETRGTAKFTVKDLAAQDFTALRADLSVSSRDLTYGGRGGVKRLEVKARIENGRAVLPSCTVRFDEENKIDLSGDMVLRKPFTFTARGDVALPKLAVLEPFIGPVLKSGGVFSELDARGQLQPWQCSGNANLTATGVRTDQMSEQASAVLDAEFEGTRANLTKLEATLGPWRLGARGVVDDKHADLSELRLWQKDTQLLDGHARVPFDLMQAGASKMDVAIQAKDLKLHEVLASAGIRGVPAAVMNADIALGGRLDSATGSVKLHVRDVRVPNAPKAFQPASVNLDVTLAGERIKSLATVSQPPLQPLTVEGELPFDAATVMKEPKALQESPVKITATLPESDLSFLRDYAPEMIQSIPAKLRLHASVSGKVSAPQLHGALDIDAPEVAWAKPDMPSVRDVKARIRASEKKISIEDVSATLAGGRVGLGGTVDISDVKQPRLDLRINAREALAYRDPEVSARANADLTCKGTLSSAKLEGLVEIVRGRVFKEIDLMPALKLPADVPPVPVNTRRSEDKLTLPPMLKDWTFDLKVRTRDPVLISGNLANGAVSTDIKVAGTGAAPVLNGRANVDRMMLRLPFSVVKIAKGVVTLDPEKPFNPKLDVRGESRIGPNDIVFYVYGDAAQPKTRFTSTPPMSEPDIITLLATGTTISGSASELATEAATRAAFLFLAEQYRKTFHKKKVVRDEPPKLNMTFNPSGSDRGNDSVQASYDLTEKWRIIGRFTQSGRMRAALGYLIRFGKAAQTAEEAGP